MSGIPVVIDEKNGLPVKPVADKAPLMTVSENGSGFPIKIDEVRGAPFVVQGLEPAGDVAPYNITPPTVSPQSPQVNDLVTAYPGTYGGTPEPTVEHALQQDLDGVVSFVSNPAVATPGARYRAISAAGNSAGQTPIQYSNWTDYVPAAEADNVAPFFKSAPSINPPQGPVGATFTVTKGTYDGTSPIDVTGTLTQAGSDVTSAMDGNTFTSTAAGPLVWSETASNGVEPDAEQTATATVQQAVQTPSQRVNSAVLATAPALFLAEPTGTTIPDASGNNRNAAIVGTPGNTIASGPAGMPFFESTASSYAVVQHAEVFNSAARTVAFWYNPTAVLTGTIGVHRSANERMVGLSGGFYAAWSSSNVVQGAPMPTLNEWEFYGFVLGAGNLSTLYTSKGATSGALRSAGTSSGTGLSSTFPLTLGARATSATTFDRIGPAGFAKFARWDRALTQEELTSIYAASLA